MLGEPINKELHFQQSTSHFKRLESHSEVNKFYIPFKDDPSSMGKYLNPHIDQTHFMNLCEEWATEDSKVSIFFKTLVFLSFYIQVILPVIL